MSNPQREIANFLSYNSEQLEEIKENSPQLSKAISSVVNALVTKYADYSLQNEYILVWSEMYDKTDENFSYLTEIENDLRDYAIVNDIDVTGGGGYIKNKILMRLTDPNDGDNVKEIGFRCDIGSGDDWNIYREPLQSYMKRMCLEDRSYELYLNWGQGLDFNSIRDSLKDKRYKTRKYNVYCTFQDRYYQCRPRLVGWEIGPDSYWAKEYKMTPVFALKLREISGVETVDGKFNRVKTQKYNDSGSELVVLFKYDSNTLNAMKPEMGGRNSIANMSLQQLDYVRDYTQGKLSYKEIDELVFDGDETSFVFVKKQFTFVTEQALMTYLPLDEIRDKKDDKPTSDSNVDLYPIWLPDPAKNTGNRNAPTQSASSYYKELEDIIPDLLSKIRKAQETNMAILRVLGNDKFYYTLVADKNDVIKWKKTYRSEDEISDYVNTLPDNKKDSIDNKSKKELEALLKEKKEALAYFEPSDQEYVDLELEIDDIEEQIDKLN